MIELGMEEIYEEYKFARNNIQVVKVTLVEVHAELLDKIAGEYRNEIEFLRKFEHIDAREVQGYLKTIVRLLHIETQEPHLIISIAYKGSFMAETEFNKEEFLKYVDAQMLPLLLPYARSKIASISSEMGMNPPIIIPTLDVLKTIKLNRSSGEEVK